MRYLLISLLAIGGCTCNETSTASKYEDDSEILQNVVPQNPALRDQILGVWTDGGFENASFDISKDSILYVDALETFKYTLSGDTMTIFYTDYILKSKVAVKNDTLYWNDANTNTKFWRFKN